MKKWEYKTVLYTESHTLNWMGSEGWELVQIMGLRDYTGPDSSLAIEQGHDPADEHGMIAFFKREITGRISG